MNVKILLFPTDQIKYAISQLYAHVLKFMIRAMKWYAEGKVKHFIIAVFQPASLRFKDLLENIERCAQAVDQLAVGASQAEQRSMHLLLQEISRTMTGNVLGMETRICMCYSDIYNLPVKPGFLANCNFFFHKCQQPQINH